MSWRSTRRSPRIRWATRRYDVAPSPVPGARRWWLLVAALLGPLLVVSAVSAQPADPAPADPVELIPDLTIVLPGAVVDDGDGLVERLERIDGVATAALDARPDVDPVVHLALAEGPDRARPSSVVLQRVEAELADQLSDDPALIGGAGIVDQRLLQRFDWSVRWLAWLALAIGGALGLVFGLRRGAVTGLACGAAVLAAASVGRQVVGGFDGTVATTPLPAALAALVVGSALGYRLLVWFQNPVGSDGASRIERAIVDVLPELALIGAGLVATTLIVEPLDAGRSAMTGAVAGAAVAAVTVLALVTPVLTLLGADTTGRWRDRLPASVGDGRDLPLAVIGLTGLALVILSVASFGAVGGDLYGVDDLGDDSDAARVAAIQAERGGDPTAAVVALAPEATTAADFAGWAAAVAERPEVAWVDLADGRLTAAGAVEVAPAALLADPDRDDVALVVPAVAPRAAEGRGLVDGVLDVPLAGGRPALLGPTADAGDVADARTSVLVAVLSLAVVSALAVFALTSDLALASVAGVLRLIGGGATVGLHHLVAVDPSAASALTAVVTVGIGAGLAELELIRRVDGEHDLVGSGPPPPHRPPVPGPVGANLGQYGGFGLMALALGGLLLALVGPLGGAPGSARLGMALLLAAVVEVVVGVGVLRPALLVPSATYHTVARPFRVAVHGRSTGDPQGELPPDDDPQWRDVVLDLIQAEYWMQAEPTEADLDRVFEADTPVHRQAIERRANLVGAGLRVVGRSPELRALRTVRDRAPVIVTVTVDHPESQLLDADGRVVGVRRPERRVGRLWLAAGPDGVHRIAESIELGATPLVVDDQREVIDLDPTIDPTAV